MSEIILNSDLSESSMTTSEVAYSGKVKSVKNAFGKNSKKHEASEKLTGMLIRDIEFYLESGPDKRKRLTFLSRKIGVHPKTLNRILSFENQPSLATILKVYRFLWNVSSDFEVLNKMPPEIKEFLQKQFPVSEKDTKLSLQGHQKQFLENPVALELFLLGAVGLINRKEVNKRFGSFGVEVLESLVDDGFIVEKKPGAFELGAQSVEFTPEIILKSGLLCSKKFGKPENGYELGRHYMGFYLERLSSEGFQKWMAIEKESMEKKIALSKELQNRGNIPVFTFNIVETLLSEENS